MKSHNPVTVFLAAPISSAATVFAWRTAGYGCKLAVSSPSGSAGQVEGLHT
jgi:hypothetical protein